MRAKMAAVPLRKITHKGEVEVREESYHDLQYTKLTENPDKDYSMDRIAGDHSSDATAAQTSAVCAAPVTERRGTLVSCVTK